MRSIPKQVHRYIQLILTGLFMVLLVILAKQMVLLLLIAVAVLWMGANWHYRGLIAGGLSAILMSMWFWLFQPANITVENWLISSLLLLLAGASVTYVHIIQRESETLANQSNNLSTQLHDVHSQLNALKVALPDRAFIFDRHGNYVDVISQLIAPEVKKYLIGKHVTETPETLKPETAQQLLEKIQETIRTGESQILEYEAFTSKEQMWCWLEGRTSLIHQTPERDPLVVWVARDVSQQRTLQESLKKVQHLAHIGIWETDVQANYVSWSDEMYTIYGITPDEFGHTVEDVTSRFHPDDLKEFQRKIEQGINPYPTEYRIVRPDQSLRTVFAVGDTIYDAGGQVTRRIGLLQDITERKQADQERVRLQIEQQRTLTLRNLISNVSHDIMTPLTIIKTSLYILNKTSDTNKIQQHIHKVEAQIDTLQQLFEDLLTVSYLDNIRLDNLKPKSSNFVTILDSLTHQFRSLMQQRNQTLTTDLPDYPIALQVDIDYMRRAVSNVLQNAMQYTPDGGQIHVALKEYDTHLIVSIQDNGIGISSEDQPHIFERFYRVEQHRPASGSSGLGLNIAKLIVELHGGRIEVESTAGAGSTFHIILQKV